MRGLVLLVGVMLIATPLPGATSASSAPAPSALDPSTLSAGRLLLQCNGTMTTPGNTQGSPVIANGTVDLGAGRVAGFGIGVADIVSATPEMIAFGDSPDAAINRRARTVSMPKGGSRTAPQVLGSFDRTTGETSILVHAGGDPQRAIIAMNLLCRMTPAPVVD